MIASDTDSVYITFEKLIDKLNPKDPVKFLDQICTDKIEPFIDGKYAELAEYVNAYEQKMVMKREVIADKGIWTAKKRYILNVHNSEGVQYAEPKLKMMGIEAVKSSTPQVCRDKIKDALKLIMVGDEKELNDFIQDFRKEWMEMDAAPSHFQDHVMVWVNGKMIILFIEKVRQCTLKVHWFTIINSKSRSYRQSIQRLWMVRRSSLFT